MGYTKNIGHTGKWMKRSIVRIVKMKPDMGVVVYERYNLCTQVSVFNNMKCNAPPVVSFLRFLNCLRSRVSSIVSKKL